MNRSLPTLCSILTWLLVAFFFLGAYGNTFISQENATAYIRWGYPDGFHYVTAFLELLTALLLMRKRSRPYGAGLGTLLMAAAALTTLLNADYGHMLAPIVVLSVSLAVLSLSLAERPFPSRP
jgi:hypothetical protein